MMYWAGLGRPQYRNLLVPLLQTMSHFMKGKYILSLLWQVFSIFCTCCSQKGEEKSVWRLTQNLVLGRSYFFTYLGIPGRLIQQWMLMPPPTGGSITTLKQKCSSPWETAEGTDGQPCLGDKGTAVGTMSVWCNSEFIVHRQNQAWSKHPPLGKNIKSFYISRWPDLIILRFFLL